MWLKQNKRLTSSYKKTELNSANEVKGSCIRYDPSMLHTNTFVICLSEIHFLSYLSHRFVPRNFSTKNFRYLEKSRDKIYIFTSSTLLFSNGASSLR